MAENPTSIGFNTIFVHANDWQLDFTSAPELAANWLNETFSAVAKRLENDAGSATVVRIDAIDTDAGAIALQLERALPLDAPPWLEKLKQPILALGGLPNQFPAGHWRHYREAFAEAFMVLTLVAVRLGYPAD